MSIGNAKLVYMHMLQGGGHVPQCPIAEARDVRPRGQFLAASASSTWPRPRPRVCGLGFE